MRPRRTKLSYTPVESVRRALAILRLVNELGVVEVRQISSITGMHKATIVRMLETLMAEGYIMRDECFGGGYCVTSEVKALSLGFSGRPRLIEAAREQLIELTRKVKWPVSIASLDADKVIVDFSTSPLSHWSYPFAVIGESMDITASALGRVSLAFCSAEQRKGLITRAASELEISNSKFIKTYVDPAIVGVLERGFAVSVPAKEGARHRYVAVPVMEKDQFVAALGVGFYMTAVTFDDMHNNIVVSLKSTAEAITEAWKSKS